ncbi:MAG: glycosyltransferase family 4 protein [Candidatus Thiodiazotropha sp.]
MNKVAVATDVWIKQDKKWQQSTRYLFDRPVSDKGIKVSLKTVYKLLTGRDGYDVFVSADVRTAVIYGIVRYVTGLKKPKHIVLELRLDEERDTLKWKLKRLVQSAAFSTVDKIYVSARKEIELYSLRLKQPTSKFEFLPFHTNVVNPAIAETEGKYIFSAGRTGRDYKTLIEAVRGEPCEVVIVSDSSSIAGIEIPENVTVYENIDYSEYRQLLTNAYMVVLPLYEHIYSSGQVVVLESMALGKPVITNKCVGTEDYIVDGETGLLLKERDPTLFKAAINKLFEDIVLRDNIKINAMNEIKEKHTFRIYVDTILEEARRLGSIQDG